MWSVSERNELTTDDSLGIEEVFEKRSIRTSVSFIAILLVCLVGLIPVFFFLLHNVPAGIGSVAGAAVCFFSLFLVLRGRQRVGSALFFVTVLLIILAVAFVSAGDPEPLPTVVISVVGLSLVVLIPTGILVSPMFSALCTGGFAVGLALAIYLSGHSELISRVPLFLLIYLFGGGAIFMVSRIQNDLLSRTVDEARKNRDSLAKMHNIMEEVGTLRTQMDATQESVNEGLAQVREIVTAYTDKVARLADSSRALADEVGSNEQTLGRLNDAVRTISESVEQQSGIVRRNAEDQESIVSSIVKVAGDLQEAEKSIAELQNSARFGRESVETVVKSMQELEGHQSKMTDMTRVISRIAAQTNLLAMNASIEAAHAGSYGRGFAVVADEVRTLSDESTSQTKQINGIIKNMDAMMEEGLKLADRAGGSLQAITQQVDASTPVIRDVYKSMNDYVARLRSMLDNTKELVNIANRIAENASRQSEIFGDYERTFRGLAEYSMGAVTEIQALQDYSRQAASILDNLDTIRKEHERLSERLQSLLSLTDGGGDPEAQVDGVALRSTDSTPPEDTSA